MIPLHVSNIELSFDLRIDGEQGGNPTDGFPLVNAPPDDPGDDVVDQEGH